MTRSCGVIGQRTVDFVPGVFMRIVLLSCGEQLCMLSCKVALAYKRFARYAEQTVLDGWRDQE